MRLLAAPFIFAATMAWAQSSIPSPGPAPSIDQSLNLKTVGSPRISPDGRFIAYVVNETNWEDDSFEAEIAMSMTATGEHYPLTHAKRSSREPRWSPDSKRLAFLSDRDGSFQIYVISPAGGEATGLTHFEGGVHDFLWSPDGKRIAFTATGPEPKIRKDRREKYGDFEIAGEDYNRLRLWVINTDEEHPRPEPLTSGAEFSVGGFSWAPDSRRIAFSATATPDLSSTGTADLYLVRISDRNLTRLVSQPGPDRNPLWSPDGSRIAFEAAPASDYMYTNTHVAMVSAEGGQVAEVSLNLNGEAFDESPQLLAWSTAGIYFQAAQRTASHLFRLNPANGSVARISSPVELELGSPSFSQDFSRVAFTCAGPNQFTEVCLSAADKFAPRIMTNMAEQARGLSFAYRELVQWKSKDGTAIEGVLLKPKDFDPSRKYPLLVLIHGGPRAVERPLIAPDRLYPVEQFVAKGALVLEPNYRGSNGYGEKFRALNVQNLGLGDANDILSGVDSLIERGFVDPARLGAMGWSQGGFIAAFLGTSSGRFRAVSAGAGISDWLTYYVNTDIPEFTRQYLKATPWNDPEMYRKTSPIAYVHEAKTPVLLQHGDLDRRVPLASSNELYQALRDQGVPAKLIVYKGLGHAINKPKQQRAVMEHNFEWFNQWIWGPAETSEISKRAVSAKPATGAKD